MPAKHDQNLPVEASYKPSPALVNTVNYFDKWRVLMSDFKLLKIEQINEQRDLHKSIRKGFYDQNKRNLAEIRLSKKGTERFEALSINKMQHAILMAGLSDQFFLERKQLKDKLAADTPGDTFHDFLMIEAANGDNAALNLARNFGTDYVTEVSRKREFRQLRIVAAVTGHEYRPVPRMSFTHYIERNGSVVFNLGNGRMVTDSAISKQLLLNDAAANSPDAVAIALRFATAKFGNVLTLTGPPEFQRLAVEIAVNKEFNINFTDPNLQTLKLKLIADRQNSCLVPDLSHLTQNQLAKGVEYVLTRSFDHGVPPHHIIVANQLAAYQSKNSSPRVGSVYAMPVGALDAARFVPELLLPHTLQESMGNAQPRNNKDLRYTRASEISRRKGTERKLPLTVKSGSNFLSLSNSTSRGTVDTKLFHHNISVSQYAEDLAFENQLPVRVDARDLTSELSCTGIHSEGVQTEIVDVVISNVHEPMISAADWIVDRGLVRGDAYSIGDSQIEFIVAYVSEDEVVINHGRKVAIYPLPPNLKLVIDQRVVINKDGFITEPHKRNDLSNDKGRR